MVGEIANQSETSTRSVKGSVVKLAMDAFRTPLFLCDKWNTDWPNPDVHTAILPQAAKF